MEKSEWLYANEEDNSCRYVLGQKGDNPLIVFGINPSIAEPTYIGLSDPTIDKIKRLSLKLDCDGWIMLNIYPQRSTNPNGMHQSLNNQIHERNLIEIQNVLSKYPGSLVVAAWGNLIYKRGYLANCLNDINQIMIDNKKEWYCFALNKSGQPKHPLYVKEDKLDLAFFYFYSGKELRS